MAAQQSGNRSCRNLDSELEQFAMNLWCAPSRIGVGHFCDDGPHDWISGGCATLATTRFSAPICFEFLPVPSHHGVGLDDKKCIAPTRPHTRDRYPEHATPTRDWRSLVAALQNEELQKKGEVLCRQMSKKIVLSAYPIHGLENDSENY